MAIRNWVHAGQFGEAAVVFNEWGAKSPTGQEPAQQSYVGLSHWLAEQGDLPHAVEVLKARLAEVPNDLDALMECGVAFGLSGDHAQALAFFDRIVASQPDDPQLLGRALVNRGVAKSMRDDLQGAVDDYAL